jgi:hypothetical protein
MNLPEFRGLYSAKLQQPTCSQNIQRIGFSLNSIKQLT